MFSKIQLKHYGLWGSLRLAFSIVVTKVLISKKLRIARFPFDIRGNAHIQWGGNLTLGTNARIETYPENTSDVVAFFGENIEINDYFHLSARKHVSIGNDVLIASRVYISDCSHGDYSIDSKTSSPLSIPKNRPLISKPVYIKDRVWIGENVVVLPGVTIGEGAIIGASSVVTHSIPPNSIAVGSPAKVIKQFNFTSQTWQAR